MNAFVGGMGRDENEMEAEAGAWATNFLIKQAAWNKFTSGFKNSEKEVRQFARQQGIAPGAIVGRLQQERHAPWKHLNHLRQKPDWSGKTLSFKRVSADLYEFAQIVRI